MTILKVKVENSRKSGYFTERHLRKQNPGPFGRVMERHLRKQNDFQNDFFFDLFQTKGALTTDLKLESTERSCEASPEISLKLETVADVGEF